MSLARELHSALASVGVDPLLCAGRSFKIGAATTAAAAGVEDAVTKILGRWQSTSCMSSYQEHHYHRCLAASSLSKACICRTSFKHLVHFILLSYTLSPDTVHAKMGFRIYTSVRVFATNLGHIAHFITEIQLFFHPEQQK